MYDTEDEEFLHKSINGQYDYPERLRVEMEGDQFEGFCPSRIW